MLNFWVTSPRDHHDDPGQTQSVYMKWELLFVSTTQWSYAFWNTFIEGIKLEDKICCCVFYWLKSADAMNISHVDASYHHVQHESPVVRNKPDLNLTWICRDNIIYTRYMVCTVLHLRYFWLGQTLQKGTPKYEPFVSWGPLDENSGLLRSDACIIGWLRMPITSCFYTVDVTTWVRNNSRPFQKFKFPSHFSISVLRPQIACAGSTVHTCST